MKKMILLCCTVILTCILVSCASNQKTKEKYTLNGSISLSALDNDNLDKTKITYKVMISGTKEDIENIKAQEPLINMDYIGLMLENGPHDPQIKKDNKYLEVTGTLIFDTGGKTKEEIDDMNLFKGIKIIDKDENEYILEFNHN